LTGLFNRRHFFTLARREFERSLRYGSPLSLIMLDADDLKVVNDHYGHLAGDQLLEMVADRCQEVLRTVDILGRYAGDEFVILLPETNRKGAVAAAERLCKNVADRVLPASEGNFRTSISIGIAELEPNCQSVEMLIERADQALYFSKRTGKNHATFWEANLLSQLQGQISK
ncbi:MAG TPA: GGDEF domain-containing protein, partial [Anaerolineaceae bacterium]|nr:GGDEF domain-containing protein [Anaerolineaceae bacterium]